MLCLSGFCHSRWVPLSIALLTILIFFSTLRIKLQLSFAIIKTNLNYQLRPFNPQLF